MAIIDKYFETIIGPNVEERRGRLTQPFSSSLIQPKPLNANAVWQNHPYSTGPHTLEVENPA